MLDTSSKSATEIVLRFRPVHQRVVAVPYPDGSAIITQSRSKRTGFYIVSGCMGMIKSRSIIPHSPTPDSRLPTDHHSGVTGIDIKPYFLISHFQFFNSLISNLKSYKVRTAHPSYYHILHTCCCKVAMVHSTKFIENNSYSWLSRGMMNLGHAYFPPFLSLHCRID